MGIIRKISDELEDSPIIGGLIKMGAMIGGIELIDHIDTPCETEEIVDDAGDLGGLDWGNEHEKV